MTTIRQLHEQIQEAHNDAQRNVRALTKKIIASKIEIDRVKTSLQTQARNVRAAGLRGIALAKEQNYVEAAQVTYAHRQWVQKMLSATSSSDAQPTEILPNLTVGRLCVPSDDFSLPLLAPFIGSNRTLVIQSRVPSKAHRVLTDIAVQFVRSLPQRSRLTLLDPHGQGKAFPLSKSLEPWCRKDSKSFQEQLKHQIDEISRIISEHLSHSISSFEQLPKSVHEFEPFELIEIANYPLEFENQDMKRLIKICRNGPSAGKYTVIHLDTRSPLPKTFELSQMPNLFLIDLDKRERTQSKLMIELRRNDTAYKQTRLLKQAQAIKLNPSAIPFGRSVSIPKRQWWQQTSVNRLQTSIGLSGGKDPLTLFLGEGEDGRPCAHGLLGAMTGSGKSNLYHVFICSLAQRYSPSELEIYLVDGKDGVEFQDYRHLPHAKAVILNSSPDASKSVVSHLLEEKERRNNLFSAAGVTNFSDYRKATGQPLARILLLVDEFQELFREDSDGTVSKQVLLLSQQGRSAGIHFFLGSQKFGAEGMLYQASTFGNVHLRVAMEMAEASIGNLSEFGKHGKRLIASCCDMPGKVVVNDRSGDDAGTRTGRVAYVSGTLRKQLLDQLAAKNLMSEHKSDSPIVLDGKSQPHFIDSPAMGKRMTSQIRLRGDGDQEPQNSAACTYSDPGRSITVEDTHTLWLGREDNLEGFTKAEIQRQPQENVILIGTDSNTLYGMITASLWSLALAQCSIRPQIHTIDLSTHDAPWHGALVKTCSELLDLSRITNSLHVTPEGSEQCINSVCSEVERRSELDHSIVSTLGTIFLVIGSPHRLSALIQVPDRMKGQSDSELGGQLRKIFTDGPALGVHVVIGFGLVAEMKRVLDRSALQQFRHRVVMQISEDDSFILIQSRKAAMLQAEGKQPVFAIYRDLLNDTQTKFKPFAIGSPADYGTAILTIADCIEKRR